MLAVVRSAICSFLLSLLLGTMVKVLAVVSQLSAVLVVSGAGGCGEKR